ncbi:SH3 domain-containing protein [Tenacibaculum halocynthiae]|uniref:SH3 domain-containing protein n=1 Tax=Tenacibaculum halocynthiae TaxID=1254437 RepID=UPI003D6572D7
MKNILNEIYQLLIPVILISLLLSKIQQHTSILKKRSKNIPVLGCYIDIGGRCTGSAYCRACKNCSSCKYCNNGGSCGVCSDGYKAPRRKKRKRTYPKKQKSIKRNIYDGRNNSLTTTQQLKEEPLYLRILLVNKENLSLRSGPSITNYEIQQLDKGEELVVLAMHAQWIKVKVKRTQTIGFVYYKYVVLVND